MLTTTFQGSSRGRRGGYAATESRRSSSPRSTRTSAICPALVAAPLRRLSLTTHRLKALGWDSSRRIRPTNTSSRPAARSGVGTSSTITPGAPAISSRTSSGVIGSRVCTLTASEWQIRTGTRTHVTATPIDSSSGILRVSNIILRSSSVWSSPSTKFPAAAITLKAIGSGLTSGRGGPVLATAQRRARLGVELVDRLLAGARDRLVGRDDETLDPGRPVNRRERHDELHGRAVGVGDHAAVALERVRVDLGDDERNVGIPPPGRGVVDHDGAGLDEPRRPLAGGAGAGREQRDVEAAQVRVVIEGRDGQAAVELTPRGSRGRERDDLRSREAALPQELEHGRPDDPGGADDGDTVGGTHRAS